MAIYLLMGLWIGMGLGMAVTAFVFLPNHPVYIDTGGKLVKSPQTLLAEWALKQ